MQNLTVRSHVGLDGIVQIQLPPEFQNQNVTITIQPEPEQDWLSILEETAGSIPDLERLPQGDYEVRESL